jgi:hypothetical protein
MLTLPGSRTGNLLLEMLPANALERSNAREEDIPLKHVLLAADETPQFVYFPHHGSVASIVRATVSGQMVEAGVVGGEGLCNIHTVLAGAAPTGSRMIVQNEGRFTLVAVQSLKLLFNEHAGFRDAVLAYTSVFLDQVTQNLVCNRLHNIEQRLAKWLLVMRDRVLRDELHMTQEFLAYMLGVHRPGVSLAVKELETEGLIRHRRNLIALVDPDGILARACECYLPLRDKLLNFFARVS